MKAMMSTTPLSLADTEPLPEGTESPELREAIGRLLIDPTLRVESRQEQDDYIPRPPLSEITD